MFVEHVSDDGRSLGGGTAYGYGFTVRCDGDPDWTASMLMHELGHELGLRSDVHAGIGSEDVPFEEYPSVMNCNAPSDYVGFSNGTAGARDHDDWATIADGMDAPGSIPGHRY